MQQAAQTVAPATPGGFAGILAALSGPAQKTAPAWNDEGLEEDVATLSYERALRTHARYRPALGEDQQNLAEPVALQAERPAAFHAEPPAAFHAEPPAAFHAEPPAAFHAEPVGALHAEPVADGKAIQSGVAGESEAARRARETFERNLKRASVTVRLSEAERAQLDKRAVEAGLTVSAYLRSCTFEAEALRAQVKEALAELRAGGSKPIENPSDPARQPGNGHSWIMRMLRPFLFWQRARREAQA